jgi:uncharacterized protein (TIGR03435 family)
MHCLTLAAMLVFQGAPSFDVASVKPNKLATAGGEGAPRENITASPGSLIMRAISLQTAIKWAYSLRDFQISGPGWIQSEKYDINAKGAAANDDQLRQMLRTLLADRFQLKIRTERKDRPVYDLVQTKGGAKLHASTKDGAPVFGPSGGELVFRNYSMSDLADRLSSRPFKLDLPVLDRTELDGRFDFALKLAGSDQELKHALEGMEQGPSIFVYFQNQLGLKLETRKGPIETLSVESANRVPSGN